LHPDRDYIWIKNDYDCSAPELKEGEWYCVFAILEDVSSNLIIASPYGLKIHFLGPDMDVCHQCLRIGSY
jgi:hypothetical protein